MKIKKIVDLSHSLNNNTVVYPGDPIPKIEVATTILEHGYNLSGVYIGTQSGSHIDAPYHFNNIGTTVEKVNLNLCMGSAVIINVSNKLKKEAITLSDIKKYDKKIKKADIVLFRTDWYKKIGTDEFFDHPYLLEEVAEYLIKCGIKTIGIDAINADETGGVKFPVHDLYSKEDGIIAENLAYFDKVDFENILVIFLPLKLDGCDGSPVRAVAIDII